MSRAVKIITGICPGTIHCCSRRREGANINLLQEMANHPVRQAAVLNVTLN